MEREEALEKYKWNLKDLYESQEAWEKDFKELEDMVEKFSAFKGKLNEEETLKKYLKFNEYFSRKFMKVYLYSYLGHDVSLKDDTFQTNLNKIQNMQVKLSQATSYISPELASIDDAYFKELMKKEEFKDHRLGFEGIMENKEHVLSEIEEAALSITSSYEDGFNDIYDTLIDTSLVFPPFVVDGKEYKLNDELYGLYLIDSNREVREKAYNGLYEVYKQYAHTFAKLFVYHLKQGSADLELRNYDSYLNAVLKGSKIPEGVYYNLVNQVSSNVDVMKEHLLEINPEVLVHGYDCFFLPETKSQFDFSSYDYVIDAVDTVTAKLALVEACK